MTKRGWFVLFMLVGLPLSVFLYALAKLYVEIEIAPELSGHGLPLIKCEAYNRVYDQPYESR
jgi:hypothetical protein